MALALEIQGLGLGAFFFLVQLEIIGFPDGTFYKSLMKSRFFKIYKCLH